VNEIVFERALPMFAVICLAGMALWKIRPLSSPLWAPVVMALAIAFAVSANRGYLTDRDSAGIVLAAVAAFFYMDWRSIHRPKPTPWKRKTILITVGCAASCVAIAAAVAAVQSYSRRHPWERDPVVRDDDFGPIEPIKDAGDATSPRRPPGSDSPPTREEIEGAAKKR
jgi:hypothetical protein